MTQSMLALTTAPSRQRQGARRDRGTASMSPGGTARKGEIVGIGHNAALRRLGVEHLVGNAVPLAIADRLFLGVEVQAHLLAGVAGARPAHQRLDLLGLG